MSKTFLLISAMAMTTLFAQANDVDKLEATVSQIMNDATTVSSSEEQVPKGDSQTPQDDKNDTQKEDTQNK